MTKIKDTLPATIDLDKPQGVVLTADEWLDKKGQALMDFVAQAIPEFKDGKLVPFNGVKGEYACDEIRRDELDHIPGWQDQFLPLLFRHMAQGKSYESFGGRYFLSKGRKDYFERTIHEWRIVKEAGWLACREKWEELGIDLAEGNRMYGNAAVYNATMKALFREAYGDQAAAHGHLPGGGGKVVINISVVSSGPDPLVAVADGTKPPLDITALQNDNPGTSG